MVAVCGLLVASYFVSIPRAVWLVCFGVGGSVLAGLLAQPYVFVFLLGSWMQFRGNVIYFWVLVMSVAIVTLKAFASPASAFILGVLLALLVADGVLGLGQVGATWRLMKYRHSEIRPRH